MIAGPSVMALLQGKRGPAGSHLDTLLLFTLGSCHPHKGFPSANHQIHRSPEGDTGGHIQRELPAAVQA